MEETLYKTELSTPTGMKTLEVMQADMSNLSFYADVLVCSAFVNEYSPVDGTLIGALQKNQGISVKELAKRPRIDMRQVGVWLSEPVQSRKNVADSSLEMGDRHIMGSGLEMGDRHIMGSGLEMGDRHIMGSGLEMGDRYIMGSGLEMGDRYIMGSGLIMGSRHVGDPEQAMDDRNGIDPESGQGKCDGGNFPESDRRIGAIACVEMTDWYRNPVSDRFVDSFREKTQEFIVRMEENQEDEVAFRQIAGEFRTFYQEKCSESWNGSAASMASEHLDRLTDGTDFRPQELIEFAEMICTAYMQEYEMRQSSHEESRIGSLDWHDSGKKDAFLLSYSSLFTMLRFANLTGVPVHTIVLPLLGAGNQMLDAESSAMALITESQNALATIDGIKRIVIADISSRKAEAIAGMVRRLYPEVAQKAVFISYNHEDSYYAEYLAEQLVKRGIKVWIDSQKLKASEFGGMIVEAIESSDMLAVLISRNSMKSKHVLAEVANAFNAESDPPEILPVRLDQTPYNKDFRYYLIGKHFEKAEEEPRERELEKIAENILQFFEEQSL